MYASFSSVLSSNNDYSVASAISWSVLVRVASNSRSMEGTRWGEMKGPDHPSGSSVHMTFSSGS